MSDTFKLRQTLDTISRCLETLKKDVESINDYIGTETIASAGLLAETMDELTKLRDLQDSLKKEYKSVFKGEKCSEVLDEIVQGIEQYEAELAEKKLYNRMQYVRIRFESIRSDVSECQKYLDEYAEQLKALNELDYDLAGYVKASAPYERFYNIVDNGSLEEKIDYSEQQSVFSGNTELMLYLIQEKIYVDKSLQNGIEQFDDNEPLQLSFDFDMTGESEDYTEIPFAEANEDIIGEPETSAEEMNAETAENEEISAEEKNTETADEEEIPVEEINTESAEEEKATAEEMNAEITEEEVTSSEEINVESTEESSAEEAETEAEPQGLTEESAAGNIDDKELKKSELIASGIKIGTRSVQSCKVEEAEVGSNFTFKKFKKDAGQYNNGNGLLLFAYNRYAYLTEQILEECFLQKNTKFSTKPLLESLYERGYIRRFRFGEKVFFGLSKRGKTCLSDRSSMAWFNRFYKNMNNMEWTIDRLTVLPKDQIDNPNSILARAGYCELSEFVSLLLPRVKIRGRYDEAEKYVVSSLELGKCRTSFLIISCFLSNEDEISGFLSDTERALGVFTSNNTEFLLIAAYDPDEGRCMEAFLRKNYADHFYDTDCCIFSISDGKYYNSENSEPVEREDLLRQISLYHSDKTNKTLISKSVKDTPASEKESEPLKTEETHSEETGNSEKADNDPKPEDAGDVSESSDMEKDAGAENDASGVSSDEDEFPDTEIPDFGTENIFPENVPFDDEIMNNVFSMINNGKAYCASAYLGTVSSDERFLTLKNELALALNAPDKNGPYVSDIVTAAFEGSESIPGIFRDCLKICAGIRVLFYNESSQDYNYRYLSSSVLDTNFINMVPAVSDLIGALEKFRNDNRFGIDAVADYRAAGRDDKGSHLPLLVSRAASFYEGYIRNPVKENCVFNRYIDMKKLIFSKDGQIAKLLKGISGNNKEKYFLKTIREFLVPDFIAPENEIAKENFIKESFDEYIEKFWNEAGKMQNDCHVSGKLVSSLRNNVVKSVKKIVTTICEWYYYAENESDAPSPNDFIIEKNTVSSSLESAMEAVNSMIKKSTDDAAILAGLSCIKMTLSEFRSRLNGDYRECHNRYFYADFLKYGDVLLDSRFIPLFKGYNIVIDEDMPVHRILRHAARKDRDFAERIEEIFNRSQYENEADLADDYGCAYLIKEYLKFKGISWDGENNCISRNAEDASEQFKTVFENFKGTLELSQCFGRTDNERREQLLEFVNRQYLICEATLNYGYFTRIINSVEKVMMSEAKNRGKVLEMDIEKAEKEFGESENASALLIEARNMIEIQNYTVAEDILLRIYNKDTENRTEMADKCGLREFVNQYPYIYDEVRNQSQSLKKIVRNSRRLTDEALNGISLIDNFPSGANTSPERISLLLSALGFRVDKVVADATNQTTYDSYTIKLMSSANVKRENYCHPIAPFGSLAEKNGFRVICLFGMYDAKRLVEKFKSIGTSKHTVVFLDHALNAPERQSLARLIKEEITDKIFIVADRVAIYYLAIRYRESVINSLLMEITMPYSYYQPYSVTPDVTIPVEMFTGRKEYLEDVKSSSGVQVIFGGRGLGKSTLLKMAKAETDNNENGDRAVYVDIRDLGCEKAAEKISAALVDEGILPDDSETGDWNKLARAIKKRLAKTDDNIPYLLLLMDEADAFFEDCRNKDYAPFNELNEIKSIGSDRFKFAAAARRDLRGTGSGGDSIIARINRKALRPLKYYEARELLLKPLRCLGIRFPVAQDHLASLIIASACYYPGIIHFCCSKLIETVKKYDPVFDENNSPPYEVSESLLRCVLSEPEFRKQIKDRLMTVLSDNNYHILVVILAYCCYSAADSEGYSAEDIIEIAGEYSLSKITDAGIAEITSLLEELCEINILKKVPDGKYMFARHAFLQLLGRAGEIDEMIVGYSEEGEHNG